ncbi:MAG: hypothetical protein WBD40_21920 [Tepidisphaeraceae bacterium]
MRIPRPRPRLVMIQRKSVDLPPALGIIAQILLSMLVGAIGLMPKNDSRARDPSVVKLPSG